MVFLTACLTAQSPRNGKQEVCFSMARTGKFFKKQCCLLLFSGGCVMILYGTVRFWICQRVMNSSKTLKNQCKRVDLRCNHCTYLPHLQVAEKNDDWSRTIGHKKHRKSVSAAPDFPVFDSYKCCLFYVFCLYLHVKTWHTCCFLL